MISSLYLTNYNSDDPLSLAGTLFKDGDCYTPWVAEQLIIFDHRQAGLQCKTTQVHTNCQPSRPARNPVTHPNGSLNDHNDTGICRIHFHNVLCVKQSRRSKILLYNKGRNGANGHIPLQKRGFATLSRGLEKDLDLVLGGFAVVWKDSDFGEV